MDSKELRGLYEAYQQVNAPQEVDEAVKGESSERRKDLAAERKAGHRPLPAKEGEKYASHKLSQMAYAKRRRMGEELDIFDVVLEFLQAEGFAETLEEAEWMMANMIDEEAIDIIIGEAITSEKGKAKAAEMIAKRSTPSGRAKAGQGASVAQIKHIGRANVDGYGGTPPNLKVAKNPVKSNFTGLNTGTGNKAARRAGLTPTREKPNAWKEEFELWVDALVGEGYDLSGYTWDEMYEFYLDEDAGIISGLAGLALGARGASYAAKHSKRMRDYPKNFVKGIVDPRTYVSKKKKEQKEEYVGEAQEARNNPEKYEADQKKKSAPVRGEKTPMPPRGDKRREDFEKWYAKQMGR